MSSSPTAATSTIASSISSPSRPSRVALIACGAIAQPCASRSWSGASWPVDVHPLPPLLHNQPQRIAAAVGRAPRRARLAATTASSSATPTAAPTARSTSSAPIAAWCGSKGCTATTCTPAPTGWPPSSSTGPGPTCSPTSWCARSTAASSSSWDWTATPSCVTTTSGTTTRSSGSPSIPTPTCAPWRAGRGGVDRAAAAGRRDRHRVGWQAALETALEISPR